MGHRTLRACQVEAVFAKKSCSSSVRLTVCGCAVDVSVGHEEASTQALSLEQKRTTSAFPGGLGTSLPVTKRRSSGALQATRRTLS